MRASHGRSRTPEYRSWAAMRQRCTNPDFFAYKDYGGRGITICDRWSDFNNFYKDMGDRPSLKHTLDRVDPNGNYCPENCRWATWEEQSNNKRKSRKVSFNGETKTIQQWSKENKKLFSTVRGRLIRGWDVGDAVTEEPIDNSKFIECDGVVKREFEWLAEYGITRKLLSYRLSKGWSIEEALQTPQTPSRVEYLTYKGITKCVEHWAEDMGNCSGNTLRRRLRSGWSIESALETPSRRKGKK